MILVNHILLSSILENNRVTVIENRQKLFQLQLQQNRVINYNFVNYNYNFSKPADDTCLVIHATNPIILREKLNLELQKVYEWTKANKITVNPEKSHVLIIPPKSTHQILSIKVYMDISPLKIKESVKSLGVTINSRLNSDDHINLLCGKISRFIGVWSTLRHDLPSKALQNLYYSLIHPHFLYGSIIWGNTYITCLKRLTTLQNRAVKISVGAHW